MINTLPQRIRFKPHQILEIQKEVERYKEERYPQLQDKTLYQNRDKERTNTKDKTYCQEQKQGKLEKNQNIKEKVKKAISLSYSLEELQQHLTKHNLQLYTRGKTYGIIDLQNQDTKQRKYRIKTLELQQEFENLLEFEKAREKQIQDIKKIQQEKEREIEKER